LSTKQKDLILFNFNKHLAATQTYANLDVPLCDILDTIHDHQTRQVATCKKTDQLFELMDKFVTREVKSQIDFIFRLINIFCFFFS